jgi:hypothetical protein
MARIKVTKGFDIKAGNIQRERSCRIYGKAIGRNCLYDQVARVEVAFGDDQRHGRVIGRLGKQLDG